MGVLISPGHPCTLRSCPGHRVTNRLTTSMCTNHTRYIEKSSSEVLLSVCLRARPKITFFSRIRQKKLFSLALARSVARSRKPGVMIVGRGQLYEDAERGAAVRNCNLRFLTWTAEKREPKLPLPVHFRCT